MDRRAVLNEFITYLRKQVMLNCDGNRFGFRNPAGETQWNHVHDIERMAIQYLEDVHGQVTPPPIVATFETESDGITGSTAAPIKRIEAHDDGTLEVIIAHWPR